ncbi:MAG: cyclic pyranopterin monophosphate synthase MoaC [Halobacteria archaeon]|nr:cyclic pyranopterin monophosphate synthase MoaC [Halobacteria archaeon]
MTEFSHIEDERARMVDISDKDDVERRSVASGRIHLRESTVDAIREGEVEKGNVLTTARIAGIQAVKRTWDNIPMCHQIPITSITVDFDLHDDEIEAIVEVKTTGKTGVEMEALSGVSTALLTVWDMVKSAEKNEDGQYPETRVGDIKVEEKIKRG